MPLSRGRKCRFSNNNKMDLKNNFRQLAKDLKKGSKLSLECMAFLKPGNGILASDYKKIVGKKTNKNLKKNHRLRMKDFIK